MNHHDPGFKHDLIALLAFTIGAAIGIAKILAGKNKITVRLSISSAILSGFSGLIGAMTWLYFFPEHESSVLFIAAPASLAAYIGIEKIKDYALNYASKISGIQQEAEHNSATIQHMIDTGEFSEADIQAAIRERDERRKRNAANRANS
jgi:hypothetical protein